MIPVVTVVGLYLGILIGNSVLTGIVFNRPGLGRLIVGALNQRDYTMAAGMMVIYTTDRCGGEPADRPDLRPDRPEDQITNERRHTPKRPPAQLTSGRPSPQPVQDS